MSSQSNHDPELSILELRALFDKFAPQHDGPSERYMPLEEFTALLNAVYTKDVQHASRQQLRPCVLPPQFVRNVFSDILTVNSSSELGVSWYKFRSLFNVYWINRHGLLASFKESNAGKKEEDSVSSKAEELTMPHLELPPTRPVVFIPERGPSLPVMMSDTRRAPQEAWGDDSEKRKLRGMVEKLQRELALEAEKRQKLKFEYENFLLQQCYDLSSYQAELVKRNKIPDEENRNVGPRARTVNPGARSEDFHLSQSPASAPLPVQDAEAALLSVLENLESAVFEQNKVLEKVKRESRRKLVTLENVILESGQGLTQATHANRTKPHFTTPNLSSTSNETQKQIIRCMTASKLAHSTEVGSAKPKRSVSKDINGMVIKAMRSVTSKSRVNSNLVECSTQTDSRSRAKSYMKSYSEYAGRKFVYAEKFRAVKKGEDIESSVSMPGVQNLSNLWRREADALRKQLIPYSFSDAGRTGLGGGDVLVFSSLDEYKHAADSLKKIREFLMHRLRTTSLGDVFHAIDIHHTGWISLADLQQSLDDLEWSARSKGDVAAVFRLLDLSGSGRLTPEDWGRSLGELEERSVVTHN